ncbi:hypothetical protein WJX75_003738 [Coccomyxa subellipsoidea]|uniref:Ion transport domain-containing protein n=1 Tax=Coccomyxa subellipsoidea TaxID=248742 RepID=A0ABR2YUH4_9CHLO
MDGNDSPKPFLAERAQASEDNEFDTFVLSPPERRRPSVRINLNGDVPSVPIPINKRKPSLKNPGSGPRVSLYLPEKSAQSVTRNSDSRNKNALQGMVSFPLLGRDTDMAKASSGRRSSIADWLLGCDKASQGKRNVVRFLDGRIFQWTQALALIFVLFGPDVVALMSAPNSIDPIINALLILSMAIFALDLILSVACRPNVSLLEIFMNLVTTALIALDLSWIQNLVRQNESTGYSSLTRALVLASQAGRMTRLLRVMHLVGAFRIALLIMLTVTMVPIMQYQAPADYSPPQAIASVLATMVGQPRAEIDLIVSGFFSYYLAKAGKHVGIPLLVAVGAEVWDHTEAGGGFTDRAEDRQLTTSTDGLVTIEVNIAPRNHREAALSIALALFVIIELMVFISVLNNTAMDLLVKPVAHILHVIRTQAQKVMAALDTDEKWDDNELGMMEAVVTKMSRIIAHVSSGEKGGHVLHKLQMDQEADDETKDWLDNMMSNSVSVKKGSGLVAASKLSGAHKSLQRREHADNRAMRKTLILRTGTTDMTEEGSEEGEDSLPANAEPEMKLRHSITQLDSDLLDSWDFDVFFFTPDQLIAYVALMFMHLGLTTQDKATVAEISAVTGGGRLLAALASAELAAAETLHGPEARVDLDILWIFIGEVRN